MTDKPKRPAAFTVKDGKVILTADEITIDPSQVEDLRIGHMSHDQLRAIIRGEIAEALAAIPKPEITVTMDHRRSLAEIVHLATQGALRAMSQPRRR